LSNTRGRAFPGEGDALDLYAVAVAELQGAGGAGRWVDREEFAPDPVHLVVIPGVSEHDGHLDDAVEAGSGRFEHVRHIAQRLPNLLGDRAEIAAAADRVHWPHPGQEDVVADPDARRMRQIGVARDVELGVYRLDHIALNIFGHRTT